MFLQNLISSEKFFQTYIGLLDLEVIDNLYYVLYEQHQIPIKIQSGLKRIIETSLGLAKVLYRIVTIALYLENIIKNMLCHTETIAIILLHYVARSIRANFAAALF